MSYLFRQIEEGKALQQKDLDYKAGYTINEASSLYELYLTSRIWEWPYS